MFSLYIYIAFTVYIAVTAFRDIGGRIRVCVAISVRARVSIKATLISSGCAYCVRTTALCEYLESSTKQHWADDL